MSTDILAHLWGKPKNAYLLHQKMSAGKRFSSLDDCSTSVIKENSSKELHLALYLPTIDYIQAHNQLQSVWKKKKKESEVPILWIPQ